MFNLEIGIVSALTSHTRVVGGKLVIFSGKYSNYGEARQFINHAEDIYL